MVAIGKRGVSSLYYNTHGCCSLAGVVLSREDIMLGEEATRTEVRLERQHIIHVGWNRLWAHRVVRSEE